MIAPGAVKSQTVSVLVDKSVPASSLAAIKSAVAGAVGLNAKRGDTISISQIAFAKPTTTAPAATPNKMLGYAKYALRRPRRPDLPVLHDPHDQAPRA